MLYFIVLSPFNSGVVFKNWWEKILNLITKMCDWDKMFGNPKSSFILNAIILNTKK